MILSYYGLIRYGLMYWRSPEYYINRYTALPKADKDRVVVAFTASPDEMAKMGPFVKSILDQTVRVDDIALTIPYKNTGKVPAELKKVLSVYGYSKDYDDASNLICSILREPEANTKVILVEPNVIYGPDFVQTMVKKSNENKDKIVYGGKDRQRKYGLLIKPEFFDDKISQYEKGCGCEKFLADNYPVDGVFAEYLDNYPLR